ncbi:hypothetical protein [Flavobacterium limi]|uniref:hypothetical protein n=1 Tax=Flavobacterium limi TaxID=2045105 RepID=UPI0013D7A5A0|nr:hypothetical protein [Flavobacterium limi]
MDKPLIGRQKDTPSLRSERLFAFKAVERLCQNAVPAILPNPLRFLKGFCIPYAVFGGLLFWVAEEKIWCYDPSFFIIFVDFCRFNSEPSKIMNENLLYLILIS